VDGRPGNDFESGTVIIPAERLSDLIGAIYDCIAEPGRWEGALADVCASTHFTAGLLAANLLPSGETLMSASVGYAPHWLARIKEYGEDVVSLWGGVERIGNCRLVE
jgi:hypothetical protein